MSFVMTLVILITSMLIACLGMVLTYTTFMIRTNLAKLYNSPIGLHSAPSVHIPSSVNNYRDMLPIISYLLLGHLLSGGIINHLMYSKDAE